MTTVKLLNVPFESNYKDTVYFASEQEQKDYMNSKVVRTFNDATYQRKDNTIRVPAHIDTLYNCNYVSYVNTPYTNKTMYAFIVDMEYKNDDLTIITIKTDVLQTWMFNYTVRDSFVEREHVSDDKIGLHTVPEGLETGEYIIHHLYDNKIESLNDLSVVWGVTKKVDGTNISGLRYNGLYSGIKYYFAPHYAVPTISATIKSYDDAGYGDAIQCLFIAPNNLVAYLQEDETTSVISGDVRESESPWEYTLTESDTGTKPITHQTYEPKNKKLLTYPYTYLQVSNNNGTEVVYKYERFMNPQPKFKLQGTLTPGCSIRLIPMNYNGKIENDVEGINMGKYPICNWNSDVYTNWLTQNSVNIGLQIASGVGMIVGGGIATGVGLDKSAGVNTMVQGVSSIAGTLGQIHQQSFTPPQSKGNINCGDVITSAKKNNFFFYHMTMKEENARIIDEFFSMFGYKVNRVKTPNKAHRSKYWYTKTIDVNIDGAIPNNDLQEIKSCYNNGITFWRSTATMGVYKDSEGELIDNAIV